MKFSVISVMIFCLLSAASASGNREIILKGNQAYNAGEYDNALQYYEQYEVSHPESPYTAFDRGAAYFRKEDYEAARKEFEAASIKTKDLNMEARANYNLGNCAFMQAGRQAGSDLEKAIQLYTESINFYNRALELNPKMTEAAYNLEITRLILKDMIDKQKEQQQQNQEQQEKIKKIVEKLVELAGQEEKLAGRSHALEEEKQTRGVSSTLRTTAGKIRDEQTTTRKKTGAVSGELGQLITESMQAAAPQGTNPQAQPQPDNPLVQAQTHVDRSSNFQQLAETQLGGLELDKTVSSQESARDELIKAIEALTKPQDQQQQQQQQQQDQQKMDEQKQQEQAAADDVINEEKENQEKRQQQAQGGYYAPLKDW